MNREEAIEVYNGLINTKIKEAFEFFAPELAESEDERTRREIVNFILYKVGHLLDEKTEHRFISYLEKQKEQKHPNGCFTCDEYKKGYEAGRLNGFTAGYNKAMKEQKPAEWSEKHIADIFEKVGLAKIVREQGNDALTNALQDAMLELSKVENAEWSEEDEEALDMCLDVIPKKWKTKSGILLTKWLKDNIRPQPKQEWSEEDEKMRKSILWVLESYVSEAECEQDPSLTATYPTYYKEIDWLKSLHPQYHGDVTMTEAYKMRLEAGKASSWRPSEEQMEALEKTIRLANFGTDEERRKALASLYEQLKAL